MAQIRNTFDGGTNGVGMTTGNTGGTSGNAFTAVEAALTFSSDWAVTGTLCAKYPTSGTGYGRWSIAGSNAALRMMVRQTSAQDAAVTALANVRATPTTHIANIILQGTNRLRLRQTTAGTDLWTATDPFPVGQDVRVELLVEQGATNSDGRIRAAYYLGHSDTPVEDSGWITGLNCLAEDGPLTQIYIGKYASSTVQGALYLDSVAVNTEADYTGYIGPVTTPLPTPVVTLGTTTQPTTAAATDGAQTVTWPAVPGATGYSAHHATTATPAQEDFTQVSASVTSPYTFTGLGVGAHAFGIKAKA